MKKSSIVLGLFLSIFGMTNCNNASSKAEKISGNTIVSGQLTNIQADEKIIFFRIDEEGYRNADTLSFDALGNFALGKDLSDIGFYRIQRNQNNFTNLILSPGDSIIITGDANSLEAGTSVVGSTETERLRELNYRLAPYISKADSLNQRAREYEAAKNGRGYAQVLAARQPLEELKYSISKSFINDYPNAFASLAAIENLSLDMHFEYYEKLVKGLNEKYPTSTFTINLSTRVETARMLAPGAVAPDINLSSPEGTPIALSSLKGSYVLVDFWASWCKPCRMENPNVKKLYDKYHKNGFDIYGVSLDKEKSSWMQAIADDKLTWNHVSDLKFWNSSAVSLYNINSIPFTILLNKEGEIIGKNLRGAALEEKLEEIFGY